MDSNGDAEPETGTARSSALVPYAGKPTQCARGRDNMTLATTTQATTSPRHDGSTSAPAWTPGTTILDLPNELLRDIFLDVDEAFSRTLWSLSLTCKQFRAIVEEHCEPEYNLRGRRVDDPFALMERLKEQPHLKNLIRVVRIIEIPKGTLKRAFERTGAENLRQFAAFFGLEAFYAGFWHHPFDPLDSDESAPTWLIPLLPRLETYEVVVTELSRDPDTRWYPSILTLLDDYGTYNHLQSHGFQHLCNLSLLYPKLKHLELDIHAYHNLHDGILKLPNLRTVRLDNIILDQEYWCDDSENSYSVKELHIHMYQEKFTSAYYMSDWEMFISLRKLVLHIEFPYVAYDKAFKRAPEYIKCLSAQAQSLEDLQLYSNEPYCTASEDPIEMSEYCPGQPNLRTFRLLKSLVLTDMSLMGVSRIYGPTHWHQSIRTTLRHLADMLPPSLETFTHLVWDGQTPFNKATTEKMKSRRSWGSIWNASDAKQFPNLKKVMVQNYDFYGESEEKEVVWERDE